MVQYHKEFRALLVNAVGSTPVYYESFQEKTTVPCISFLESSNFTSAIGDTQKYGKVSFMVKVWAKDIETLITLSNAIDYKLESNGFTRQSSNETKDNGIFCKILRYQGTSFEKED